MTYHPLVHGDLNCEIPEIPRQRTPMTTPPQATVFSQEQVGARQARSEALSLDPSDPFERAVMQMVAIQRDKRSDYALDGDRWFNFREASTQVGIPTLAGIDYMVATKQARLKALASNGRSPLNESVLDTYLDRAVYAVLAYVFASEQS